MRLLLDTHCWLWSLLEPDRLNERALALLSDRQNELILSAASAWEIAIKASTTKLRLPEPAETYVPSRLSAFGMTSLPVSIAHAVRVATLPFHHRDPFDRLLIAQAQVERLPLLTADGQFRAYDVNIVWAG